MKLNLQTIIFTLLFFIVAFIFGAISHGLITLILSFLILSFWLNLKISSSVIFTVLISGTINMIFNFRVFLEALVVETEGREGSFRYWKEIAKYKKNEEKYRTSVSVGLNGKNYKVIEFAKYFFDPRAKNKDDLKGFLIFSDADKNESVSLDTKKKILGIYLFWRHIYFDNVLGENKKLGLHTLFLLDLKPDDGEYMKINEAIDYLINLEKKKKFKVINNNTLCVGCAALGSEDSKIVYGKISDVREININKIPQCLIIPGKMQFFEEEYLENFKLN